MMKLLNSPLTRISFGLVMVTVSALLISDMLGMVPDARRAELKSRLVIAESLAVQFSIVVADGQFHVAEETLRFLVEKNEDILSGAVRRDQGGLVAEFGNHQVLWTLQPGDVSTPSRIQVPIFDKQGPWGTVELSFTELVDSSSSFAWQDSFLSVVTLVCIISFVGYLLFLKRTLRELDPSAVIPERVRLALDTLSEGLLIVDQDSLIVFSNHAFAQKTGLTSENLVGQHSGSLPWETDEGDSVYSQMPWDEILEGRLLPDNDVVTVRLANGVNKAYVFTVKTSPINSAEGNIRGALISFDDVTEVEKKNAELQRTLGKLEHSQREITRQNQELHILATRDPLTNLLNRRSFFEGFEAMFSEAQDHGEELACMMVDIDHFKRVNDQFGHGVGDIVIKLLATVLRDFSRPNDLVGRFGGEEFCLALPSASKISAAQIAERMRLAVQQSEIAEFKSTHSITVSLGVTDLSQGAKTVAELVDQADTALYEAKKTGRNRVILWPMDPNADAAAIQLEAHRSLEAPPKDDSDIPLKTQTNQESVAVEPASLGKRLTKRSMLSDRIEQAILRSRRHDTKIAVLSIEFDTMRRVSETLGFSVGEQLETNVILRLKDVLRSTDTVSLSDEKELLFSVSQPGGNEIVILLTDLDNTDIISTILQRIFATSKAPVEADTIEFYLDADIGVSIFPIDGEDSGTLMSCASSARREAKKQVGSNNYQFYSADVNERSRRQLRLEADLHRALERDELVVYYQPKIDLRTGEVLGMEALLRWFHPQLGMIPPNDFIPLAEQSDLIGKISERVISSACQQIKDWEKAGYGTLTIAVNLSPVEFKNPHLADRILQLVEAAGVPFNAIEVEITESVAVHNMQIAIDVLNKLSNAGISIAIDDFGVGYSSLGYLKKLPLDKLKIDRSFISDLENGPNDAALVSAIIAMGHSLNLIVVAEGVETIEELRFLQDLHCDEVQGYLISKPLPADEISELLSHPSRTKRLVMDSISIAHQGGASMFGILNEFPNMTGRSKSAEAGKGQSKH